MLEEQRNDCKFFKQHFIYRPDMQMFSELNCGHCLRSQVRKSCTKCKFYTPEKKTDFIDASMSWKMNAIIRLSNQIIELINSKNSET